MHKTDFRDFKAGAWDLRRDDRRKRQVAIAFPERRQVERRCLDQNTTVHWVSLREVDE